jgi:hypothetical protein
VAGKKLILLKDLAEWTPDATVLAMRSLVLGVIVIELLIGGLNDAGRNTETA